MHKETRSTCPYCGVGCGVIIESRRDQIIGVRGDPDHPANFGRLCSKGSTLHLTATPEVTLQQRLLKPMLRAERGGKPEAVSWDAALDLLTTRWADIIRRHGPDAVGFYISGQMLTEDYYVFNKLSKGLIGTNNIDTNSRLCMSSAVAGYKQTLGADAPPACYDDVKDADCLFITGSNTAWAHPILFRRIEDARKQHPNMKVIVVDPRRTDTAGTADLHLQIQPGTDVALYHGMLHLMLWEGWVDMGYIERHTEGFDALKTLVRDYTPDRVAQICGITVAALTEATRWFALGGTTGDASKRGATLSLYCQGLNQSSSGTAKNATLINLHLATGQLGRAGAGPFSLTGQPNAMGGREVGGMSNLLSAHRDLGNAQHRAEVAALWDVPSVPEKPGKTAVEMFQAAADGEIKALWIACTNPAQSMPDQATVRRAMERAEFVVVQEAFATTATCNFADLLLPATTWGEKDGTVTNSERRITRVLPAIPAAGEARHDWHIATEVAHRLEAMGIGPQLAAGSMASRFAYETPEAIWLEHRESTRGRDLDITGLSYAQIEQAPQQWPMPEGAEQGLARLYEDGRFPTPSGRARFVAPAYQPVAEALESRFPFALTTGRLRDQWHGMSRTGTLGRLFGHVPEPSVQLNRSDMARRGFAEGDLVHVTSKRGSILVPVQASDEVASSQAFMAMHWGPEFLSGMSTSGQPLAGVNALTPSTYCPISKQPELKHSAVKILKADMPWTLLGLAWLPADRALSARESLSQLMVRFPYASCVPFASASATTSNGEDSPAARTGILFRAASHEPVSDALLVEIEQLLGLDAAGTLRYADRKRGQRRAAHLETRGEQTTLRAVLLAGDTSAETWIRALLQQELPAQSYGRLVLLPGAKPPVAMAERSRQICTCFNVSEDTIEAELPRCRGTESDRLQALQGALKCGTNCGSCIPELQRMLRRVPASLTAA